MIKPDLKQHNPRGSSPTSGRTSDTALHRRGTARHGTARHRSTLLCTALHCTALHCTHSIALYRYGTALHHNAQHGTAQHGMHGTTGHAHVLILSDSLLFFLALFQIYALKSVSVACAAMSAATMYHYQWGIGILLSQKTQYPFYIVEKDTKFKFTPRENTMLAISSLAILFSIIEMILAFASVKSCGDTGYEPPQDNQVRIVTDTYNSRTI